MAVQRDQCPHRTVGALLPDIGHFVETGQQVVAAHIGNVLAKGSQGQNDTGILCGLAAAQPHGSGIDIVFDIGDQRIIVAADAGNAAAAAGQTDDGPFATDGGTGRRRTLLDQIVAGGLIDVGQILRLLTAALQLSQPGFGGSQLFIVADFFLLLGGQSVIGGAGFRNGSFGVESHLADGIDLRLHLKDQILGIARQLQSERGQLG